eukprot:scaffold147718_cov18-Tisochrysis_lutea.AAC.1
MGRGPSISPTAALPRCSGTNQLWSAAPKNVRSNLKAPLCLPALRASPPSLHRTPKQVGSRCGCLARARTECREEEDGGSGDGRECDRRDGDCAEDGRWCPFECEGVIGGLREDLSGDFGDKDEPSDGEEDEG